MKRIYHPYWLWEDYLNGMFNDSKLQNEDDLIQKCTNLFSVPSAFDKACEMVINKWKISTKENLSNTSQNRNAWIGAACCSIIHNAPEYITRIAWANLTIEQQNIANRIAKKHILKYETRNRKLYSGVGKQMLLQWDSRRSTKAIREKE